jgi:hypothetical protein
LLQQGVPRDSRVTALCLAVLPARVALDLLWWCEVGPLSLPQLGSALIGLGLLGVVLSRWRGLGGWGVLLGAWLLVLLLGALRADSALEALRYGLQLAIPALWVAALASDDELDWPAAWTWAPLLPVACSIGLLLAGQPYEHVLHGWPRLLGAYGNLHTHAASMAVFSATLAPLAVLRRSWGTGLLAAGASVCLLATWVRGSLAWAVLALVLAQRGRGRGLLLLGLAAVGLVALRERWTDLWALLTLTPPEGGWGALGSWRIRIWTESLTGFLAGPPAEIWLGRGLGGHFGLHRHLEPHSDWLSLLYQLGPGGLLLWLGANVALLRALLRSRHPVAPIAFGLLGSAILTALVTNDLLFRPTPLWWTYGVAGLALSGGFRQAQLKQAQLKQAQLKQAQLKQAQLKQAQLKQAMDSVDRRLPQTASTGPLPATGTAGSASTAPAPPPAAPSPRPSGSPGP